MNNNKIHVLERLGQGGSESTQFCGLSPLQTEHVLGLRIYVQKYGQKSIDANI